MSTVPNPQKTKKKGFQELLLANGSILLIYRKGNKLHTRLVFCGFPDKDNNYLNYDYTLLFTELGRRLFSSVLKENEGILFVRHEHSFHNGLIKHKMLDAPLSSFGIYKSMLINQFLNSPIFPSSYFPELTGPKNGNLYDFIDKTIDGFASYKNT